MVIELLTAHASVRKYKDVTLSKEEVHELIRAGQHAASSHFVQAYSVIYVTDNEKRQETCGTRKKSAADFISRRCSCFLHRLLSIEKGG